MGRRRRRKIRKRTTTSKVRRRRARQKTRKVREGSIGRRSYIWLTCWICKKEYHIHVNDISIYTDEVKKNWRCGICG